MKYVFIINPKSGKKDASVFLEPRIRAAAQAVGVDYTTVCTRYAGHAAEIAHAYGEAGEEARLYACGGDGTLNEVLRGAYPYPQLEVGVVPCGSGNDFVRNFGTAEHFEDLEDNLSGKAATIDLMRANNGISAAICSVGLDANVAYSIPQFRRIPLCGGHMAYDLSILKCLLGPLGRAMHIELDGQNLDAEYTIAAVCNGKTYGSGYYAAPTANLQDGRMEVVLVKRLPLLRVAKLLSLYKAGEHIHDGEVIEELRDVMTYTQAERVHIVPADGKQVVVNVDGECNKVEGLSAEMLPAAARFVLPAKLAGKADFAYGACAAALG